MSPDKAPTHLERVAREVQKADHRGTLEFSQLDVQPAKGSRGLIGFHGSGGGSSTMSMNAIRAEDFTLANRCDMSWHPSAAKVYRAARVILSQPGLVGYFGAGLAVGGEPACWSACALAKAFWEIKLDIPAVVGFAGVGEEQAIDILDTACRDLPGIIEGYGHDVKPKKIAARMAELVESMQAAGAQAWTPRRARVPDYVGSGTRIAINGGVVWIDPAIDAEGARLVVEHGAGAFSDDDGRLELGVDADEFAGMDSELIACEVACRRAGSAALFVDLEIPGLD